MRTTGEKLKAGYGTSAYDAQLNRISISMDNRPFFGTLHPELLPYIGQNYKETGILLVGESHYVNNSTEDDLKAVNWYHSPLPASGYHELNAASAESWFDTRQVFVRYNGNDANEERGPGHITFSRPTEVLHELGIGTGDKYKDFCYFAFMNFFQRPALQRGKSIQATDEDRQTANEVFKAVLQILQPKVVVFLSKKARKAFDGGSCFGGIPMKAVSHPACQWWYRKRRDGGCARDDFRDILKEVLFAGDQGDFAPPRE